ncbi:hypothetical protein OB919_01975 [Halobacteria archaeon AArc-curdl1]|uniref:Uncharacterized protein n=1 Tax=Natronosalvus hydrolyticus TaxID=2979988 RepID=A0AAP2Z548_9EURY|nr:hypothetical protein [Halobacteria archaeon AArc-curdl1]
MVATMYAIDDLSDAIDVTRNFLTPVDIWMWLKLAIILLFVGGVTFGGPTVPTGDPTGFDAVTTEEDVDSLEEFQAEWEAETGEEFPVDDLIFAIAVLAAIIIGIWLVYAFIGAIFEFVFVESLRSSAVDVRQYANRNFGRGVRLFGFRIGLLLVLSLIVGGPIWWAVSSADGVSASLAVLGVAYVGLAFISALAYVLISRFTTVFVTQIMLGEERGVLSAWSRFLPTLRANLVEYAVYVVLVWVLQFVVSIGYGFLVAIVLVVLAIPFVILAVIAAMAGGTVGLVLAGAIAAVGLLCGLLVVMLIRVPIDSYFRYYGFLILGDTNPDLDLIPKQRAAVRSDGGEPDAGDAGDTDWDDNGNDSGWSNSSWDDDDDGSEWDDDDDESTRNDDNDRGGW